MRYGMNTRCRACTGWALARLGLCHTWSASPQAQGLRFLAEALDVFRTFLELPCIVALHLDADLLNDVGIRERSDVAGVHTVLDRGEHAAHDFSGARLWHVRHHVNIFGPRDFADHSFDGNGDFFLDHFRGLDPRLQRNIHDGNAAFHFVNGRNHGSFRNLRNGEARGLDFFGAEAVARDVDDVVYTAQNAVVAVGGKHRAVRGVIRPVVPVPALGIPTVL